MKRFTHSLVVGLAAAAVTVVACTSKKASTVPIPTAAIDRRDIVVDASATGAVEPINVVEVKSKASGQITQMPVETGTLVKPGDLIVQLDTRDVKNQYDQSMADVRAAEAKLQVSESQKKRSDDLFKARIITAQEQESVRARLRERAGGARSRTHEPGSFAAAPRGRDGPRADLRYGHREDGLPRPGDHVGHELVSAAARR